MDLVSRPAGQITTRHRQRYPTIGGSACRPTMRAAIPQGGIMIRLPGRRIGYALLVVGSAAALVLAAPAAPASADPPSVNLDCEILITVDIHPGTTTELREITATTNGFTGVADCTGTVNGEPVTGDGSFNSITTGVSSCTETSTTSYFVLRIPTASGVQTIPGSYTTTAFPVVLSGDLNGTVEFYSSPREGDCFNTPLTQTTAELIGHIGI
jgi:hypothetical protein